MADKKTIIGAFLDWFAKDPHRMNEDFYKDTLTFSYLNSLTNEQFIDYFFQFAREGGKIQSQGWRTAPKFKASMIEHFDEFRSRILQMFNNDFNIDDWLIWAGNFKNFGQGLSTIILNRIDKDKYVIVNNKSFEGLQKLGYNVTSVNFFKKYKSIFEAERSLLMEFPELNNFYRVDALMHFIIGTKEGKAILGTSDKQDYFNLDGFDLYAQDFGKEYDEKLPAAGWFKDTRMKLEYLVQLLNVRLTENISINYSERPRGMAGPGIFNLKDYVLTGFSPDNLFPNGELFIKLAFHSLGKDPKFDIEFDINYKLENKPFKEKVEEIKLSTRKRIPVDDRFPQDWDSLLGTIQGHVKSLVSEYRKINNNEPDIIKPNEPMNPLNTILYGPPGTGKTYRTVDYALSIIDGKLVEKVTEERDEDEKSVKQKFDTYLKEGRIVFCTFHQSMGYEDFIEGIKPLPPVEGSAMQYDIIDGIFKKLNIEAIYHLATKSGGKKIAESLDFSLKYDLFVESVQERWSKGETVALLTKSGGKILLTDVSRNNYLIFNHPGSERPVLVSKPRLSELSSEITDLSEVNNIDKHFRSIIGGMDSTAYWASLNAIRNFQHRHEPETITDKDIKYEDKKAAVLNYTLEVDDAASLNSDKFVLIIDEINRGNIAQIFGELITLIEEDKRKGCKNEITCTLPYSGESFAVAPNLYIIGTMNTADRSVEALDTALRRRFSFVEMEPHCEKLEKDIDDINLKLMLQTINNRLEILLDKDHTIGHAWLMDVKNFSGLKQKFENRIIPLLKEFFYNEFEKIGLVLNENFFVDNMDKRIELSKFKPGTEIAAEHKNKIILKLKPIRELTKEDFISIYKPNNNTIENKDQ